jgi:hypothetical protein
MTVGGTIVFKTKKGDLQYYVVALCSHEVESIGTVFINDDVSTDKKFKDHLHIEKMTGSPDQSANAWLVSQIEE